MTDCIALVVAAGRGNRFGRGVPKQYRPLSGQPLLRRSVAPLLAHPLIDGVRVIVHPDDTDTYRVAVGDLPLLSPVFGAATRQGSALCGLESLAPAPPRNVLIHDAARPLVSAALLDRILAALDRREGAIPALPVVDTLKRGSDGAAPLIVGTQDRAGLWRAQTPQGFRYAALLAAHRAAAGQDLTDDAAVAEAAGLSVELVPGDEDNLKVTT